MNIYVNEVLAAHVAIENWLSKGGVICRYCLSASVRATR